MTRSHARQLDQFYTNRGLAETLVGHILARLNQRGLDLSACRFLEPSAGEGAFLDAMRQAAPMVALEGCDLDPKHHQIQAGDFFDLYASPATGRWVVFGNPPFGKNAMLAVKFFNHAAQFADTIAFIVPRTFEKASLKNRLDTRFALAMEVPIDPHSFHFNGERVSVPCVFQVWEKLGPGEHRASIPAPTSHPDFRFLKLPEGAAFAFQRVGVQAGRTKSLDAAYLSPPSHYFIAPRPGLDAGFLRATLDAVDWGPIKARTAGNPSISKGELIEAYMQQLARGNLA